MAVYIQIPAIQDYQAGVRGKHKQGCRWMRSDQRSRLTLLIVQPVARFCDALFTPVGTFSFSSPTHAVRIDPRICAICPLTSSSDAPPGSGDGLSRRTPAPFQTKRPRGEDSDGRACKTLSFSDPPRECLFTVKCDRW